MHIFLILNKISILRICLVINLIAQLFHAVNMCLFFPYKHVKCHSSKHSYSLNFFNSPELKDQMTLLVLRTPFRMKIPRFYPPPPTLFFPFHPLCSPRQPLYTFPVHPSIPCQPLYTDPVCYCRPLSSPVFLGKWL